MDKWKDDIEKYRAGKLTPTERHALEKKALSDPFLADALEGIEEVSVESFSSDVDELNRKIIGDKKTRLFTPLRIAASVAAIVIISSIIIYNNSDKKENLASNQEQKEKTTAEPENDSIVRPAELNLDTVKTNTKTENTESEKVIEEVKKRDDKLVAALKEEKPKPQKPKPTELTEQSPTQSLAGAGGGTRSNIPSETTETATRPDPTSDTTITNTQGFVTTPTPSVSLSLSKADDAVTEQPTTQPTPQRKKMSEAIKSNRVTTVLPNSIVAKGIVRDQDGKPIPGVNIIAKGSTIGTITDVDGKYSIEVSDKDQTLVYSFVGFEAQEQPVSKSKDGRLDVNLEEDIAQLSEVVVTGYGEKRNNSEPVVRLAEPLGGRKAYDRYLDEMKMYPQEAIENKIEGKVTIEFTVGVTGLLTDFQVTKALGYGCDEEVIRLVKEGPQWKPSYIDNEAVESLVRIKTKFKLPGK